MGVKIYNEVDLDKLKDLKNIGSEGDLETITSEIDKIKKAVNMIADSVGDKDE